MSVPYHYRGRDQGVGFTYAPDGVSFFGKYEPGAKDGLTHSVCSHFHKTESAALSCARKKRAAFRSGRVS